MCNKKSKEELKEEFEKIALDVYNTKQKTKVEEFNSINLDHIARDKEGAVCCPDQFVGIIKIEKDKDKYKVRWKDSRPTGDKDAYAKYNVRIKKKRIKNIIAIVLESPHKDEFEKNESGDFKALGPAIGATGCNILGYFPRLIYKHNSNSNSSNIEEGKYKVILVNPIQYQCSLGAETSLYRDDIFERMWSYGKNCFKNRLTVYKPKVIINCCTKKFRKEVNKIINDYCQGKKCLLLESCHPSVWNYDTEIKEVSST